MARVARAAIAVAIAVAGGVAWADQRPVAVIDLVGNLDSAQLARSIGVELDENPDLQQLAPAVAAALIGDFIAASENTKPLTDAQRDLGSASDSLNQFAFHDAEVSARDGQQQLLDVAPAAAAPVYAELSFALGQALLGQRDPKGAAAAFALTHRLAPDRPPLDPARYLPEVVRAFTDAQAPATAVGTIDVNGTGEVWLDGSKVGGAPGAFAASPGDHLVQLAGPTRNPKGTRVIVAGGAHVTVTLPGADATLAQQVSRARLVLANARDATERASAIDHIAKLVGVSDAVLLSSSTGTAPGGILQWQTWQDHAPGLSAPTNVGNSTPRDLLAPIAPVHVAVEPPPQLPHIIIPFVPDEPTPVWYRRRWVQASVVAGVVAAVVGGVLWAREQHSVVFESGIGMKSP